EGENTQRTVEEFPAVTIAVTKNAAVNVTHLVDALLARADDLRNTIIPEGVELVVTRDLGKTANDKIKLMMEKIFLVTASVAALIFIALGRRESAIVLV